MAKPIKIEILGDASGFKRALGQTDKGISGLLGPVAKLGAALGGAFAIGKIADVGKELFGLAADLTDINQKVDTVFGEQSDSMRAWADTLNEAFGVTSTEVALMAANVGDLLKPMGATTEEAAEMSKELVELAPALAEWSGGTATAAEVSEILSKAMLGEREQLKSLGISINQAEVDTRALAIAQEDGRSEITQMDKALATQALVFEKSTDAQAGYVTGTGTLAGQSNLLKARFAELKEFLATKLTPVFLKAGEQIVMFVEALRTGTTEDEVPVGLERLAFLIRNRIIPPVKKAIELFKEWGPIVLDLAEDGFKVLGEVASVVWDIIKEIIEFLDENKEVLIGVAVVIGGALVAAFLAWAVSAGAAAVATLIALAPIILIGAAIAILIALIIKLYRENETFRNVVQAVGRWLRDEFWPILKAIGAWIVDTLIPIIVDVAVAVGKWVAKAAKVVFDVGQEFDKIVSKLAHLIQDINDKAVEIFTAIITPFRDAIAWIVRKFEDVTNIPIPGWIKWALGMDGAPKAGGGSRGFAPKSGGGSRSFSGGGHPLGRNAMGTSSFGGGFTSINERAGSEAVFLPAGTRITPAHMNRGGGGDTFNFNQTMSTPEVAREIAWRKRMGDGR